MTTNIFFDNLTLGYFHLVDADNNFISPIAGGWSYSLTINYSQSFEKQYNLWIGSSAVSFWISPTGEISRVNAGSNLAKLQISTQGGSSFYNNKLIIMPKKGSLPFAPSVGFPINSRALLLYDLF